MVAFAVALWRSVQDPIVDLTNNGDTAANVVAQLAAQTHVAIEVAKPLRDEVLILHAAKQPFTAVMNQIAYALDASWTRTSDGVSLRRTSDDAAAMKARDLASRIADAKSLQKAGFGPDWKKPPTTQEVVSAIVKASAKQDFEDSHLLEVLNRADPMIDLTSNLLAALPTKALADVAPGDRVVYCDQPSGMQRAFTSAMFEARRQSLGRLNALINSLRGKAVDRRITEGLTAVATQRGPMIVVLSKRTVSESTECSIAYLDENGRISLSPGGTPDLFDRAENLRAAKEEQAKSAKREIVPTSSLSRRIAAAQVRKSNRPRLPLQLALEKADLDTIMTPTKVEPWSWMLGETLVNLVKSRGISLVVHPADFASVYAAETDSVDAEAFLADIARTRHDVVTNDGWLRIRPSVPVWAARGRIDRSRLQEWIRYVALAEQHPIAKTGGHYAQMPNYYWCDTLMVATAEFVPAASSDLLDSVFNPQPLKLLSSLSPDQIARAQSSGIPVRELSATQIQWLFEMTYGVNGGVRGDGDPQNDIEGEEILREPTAVLPNGIPTNALLNLSISVTDAWIPVRPDVPAPRFMGRPRTSEALGAALATRDRQLAAGRPSSIDYTNLYAAKTRTVLVLLRHSPNLTTPGSAQDTIVDASKTIKYDDLSAEIKKEVEAAREEAKKNSVVNAGRNQPR